MKGLSDSVGILTPPKRKAVSIERKSIVISPIKKLTRTTKKPAVKIRNQPTSPKNNLYQTFMHIIDKDEKENYPSETVLKAPKYLLLKN